MGVKLPSWLVLSNNFKEIELQGCINCEGVPTLGRLPNLVHVSIDGMQNLKCLSYEFYGYDHISDDTKVLFPALRTLHMTQARNLIEWMGVPTERVEVFSFLEELTLTGCSQLRSAPSHFPSLKKLEIGDMNSGGNAIASILSDSLTTLTCLPIWNVRGPVCLPERLLENNQNLSCLEIGNCSELTCIAPPDSHCCASLQQLSILECLKLRCLPDNGLLSLIKLEIEECPEISSLPEGLQYCTSLQILKIQRCTKINSILIPSQGFPSLSRLWLSQCPELSSLPSGLGCCTSLADLRITECPKVTSIPIDTLSASLQTLCLSNLEESLPILHGCFTSLRRLTILNCQSSQIDLQFLVSLKELLIMKCPDLETVPGLDKLKSLRELKIRDCSRLTSLPSGLAFARLKYLSIGPFWEELNAFPAFHVLPQLESLEIYGWPKLKSLPEQIQHLTSLTHLSINCFEGVEAIPDWLGNLASLESRYFWNCENLMFLPSSKLCTASLD
ncbi:hypothetical protein ACLB2K_056789 [Fragaria x ananassa]